MNFAQISLPGVSNLEQLVNGSLSEIDGGGNVLPQFAMSIPSQDNGLWALTADGGMTTTWKLRQACAGRRHAAHRGRFRLRVRRRPGQGDPLPSAHLVRLCHRRQRARSRHCHSDLESPVRGRGQGLHLRRALPAAATPPAGVVRRGRQASIPCTALLGVELRRHRASSSPPLTWVPWVSLVANKDYALGRPKIDEIEVRFITDINTLVSNLLAGTVDMSMGRAFAVDNALLLKNQWTDGNIDWQPSSWVVAFPQFMNPASPLVTNLAFRQALMYGTDRQALIDSLEGGLSTSAHFYMSPSEPEFNDVASAAMKYEYDPRKAAQLIESLSYTRSGDTYRSATGEPISIQVRSNGEPISSTGVVPLASMWSQLGVATQPDVLSTQRLTDREYLATYPYFRDDATGCHSAEPGQLPLHRRPDPGVQVRGYQLRALLQPRAGRPDRQDHGRDLLSPAHQGLPRRGNLYLPEPDHDGPVLRPELRREGRSPHRRHRRRDRLLGHPHLGRQVVTATFA